MNSENTPRTRHHTRLFLVLVALLLLAGVGAFMVYRLTRASGDLDGEPSAPQAASTPLPNIILVVVDTERADFTSPYGADPELTPALSRLAQDGILFTNAFAPGPWTVPSMFSLMTGQDLKRKSSLSRFVSFLPEEICQTEQNRNDL